MYNIQTPYLHYLGSAADELAVKTSRGINDWRPDISVGQFRRADCKASLGLDDLSMAEGAKKGAKTLVIGVANRGGTIGEDWVPDLIDAMELGMDLASGLHQRLESIPALAEAADRLGRKLINVRIPDNDLPVATGIPRTGKRILAVGTDCSCGKMYTTLAVEKALKDNGLKASFRATGQTGIFITGSGVPLDAVPADFMAGSIEMISPENDTDHFDVIEGQGSLFHPSFAGVSLALLHGSQADYLIMCHEPTRTHMRGLKGHPIPDIRECLERNLEAARLTNPNVQLLSMSVNTKALTEEEAKAFCAKLENEFGVPATDPVRFSAERLVADLL